MGVSGIVFKDLEEEMNEIYEEEMEREQKMLCTECGLELKYCEECKCYHHVDSFKEEHLEYQVEVKKLQEEGDIDGVQTL